MNYITETSPMFAFNTSDAIDQFEVAGAQTIALAATFLAIAIGMAIVWATLDKM